MHLNSLLCFSLKSFNFSSPIFFLLKHFCSVVCVCTPTLKSLFLLYFSLCILYFGNIKQNLPLISGKRQHLKFEYKSFRDKASQVKSNDVQGNSTQVMSCLLICRCFREEKYQLNFIACNHMLTLKAICNLL